jgi:hypothetical protein
MEFTNHPTVEKDTVSDHSTDLENTYDEFRDQSDTPNVKSIQTSSSPTVRNKHSFSYEDRDVEDPIRETKISSQPRNNTRRPKHVNPMQTLALAATRPSIEFQDWAMALLTVAGPDSETSPTFAQAMKGKYKEKFKITIEKEYRLCGKGFKQVSGVDYNETYAPVACYDSIRMFISTLATLDYEMDTVVVTTAFLLSTLKEEVYINIPDGYECINPNTKYLKLLKTLYGLKQSPYMWNKEIADFIVKLGFKQFITDRCVFVGKFKGTTCYLLLYVDDIIIGTISRAIMQELKAIIHA